MPFCFGQAHDHIGFVKSLPGVGENGHKVIRKCPLVVTRVVTVDE